jgi:hypothetical protein
LLQVENDAVPLEGQRHHHHRHQQHEFLSQPTLEDTQERLDKLQLNQDKEEKTAEANSDSLSSTEGQQDSDEAGQVRLQKITNILGENQCFESESGLDRGQLVMWIRFWI